MFDTEAEKQPDVAKTAGRGFLVITVAKLWFMVGGALITFGLPIIFGSSLYGGRADGVALYGQYVDLNNTMSILSMVMVVGVMQAVSKFVSERPAATGLVVKTALKLMLLIGGLVGGGFIAAGGWIAEARHNPELVNGYRAAGIILFCYAIYTVFIGSLNGRKLFLRQALFDMGFTSLKATLVLGLAVAGLGVVGAFAGFATAAFLIMALSAWRVGRELSSGGEGVALGRLLSFGGQVMLYTLVFNVIFKLDVLMLKPAAAELFSGAAGWVPDGGTFAGFRSAAVAATADATLGLYGFAQAVSRLPWQATIAITFVVFPMVSEATFQEDRERTRLYIRQTLRYSMLMVGAAAVVLAAVPQAVTGILPRFTDASVALAWLAPAYFCFSLFNVVNTLLMSSDRATAALLVGVATVLVAAGMYWGLLGGAVDTESMLRRAGLATLVAFSVGLAIGLGVLWHAFGSPIPAGTALRVVGVGAALVFVGRQLPPAGKVLSLAFLAAVGVAYLVALVLTREFGPEDKARLMRVLKRKGGG